MGGFAMRIFPAIAVQLTRLRLARQRCAAALSLILLLAWPTNAAPVITEFMADNQAVLADEDGQFSDWIEIFNPGPGPVELGGYCLTDERDFPAKWRVPAGVALPAGGFKVIFASGKNRTNAAGELHTNFQLDKNGEYLALVAPDGLTVLQSFNPYPALPENASFGPGRAVERLLLAGSNSLARVLVPTNNSAGSGWTGGLELYDDSGWLGGFQPVGYDTGTGGVNPLSNALASTAFAFRYEFDLPAFAQDLDGNGTNDWATNNCPPVTGGLALGTNNLTLDANFTNSVWRAQFGTNFTAEFRAQVLTNGTEGTYGTLSLTASKGNNVAPWLNLKRGGQTWGTLGPTALGAQDNTDTFHVFRVAREGSNCWVWRDDVLVNPGGQPLAPSTTIATGTNAFFLGDNSGTGNNGTWRLDYLRMQPGAFGPVAEPDLFGGLIRTDLEPLMPNVSAAAFIRIPFTLSGAAPQFSNLVLRVRYDDGFMAYLNGAEVARRNAPLALDWNSNALTNRADALALAAETIELTAFAGALREGTNILAFQALSSAPEAARCLLAAELEGVRIHQANVIYTNATPGATNGPGRLPSLEQVDFSLASQLFTTNLTLVLTHPESGAAIYFTRDGTAPSADNGTLYTSPITITNSVSIRAVAVLAGFSPSPVKSESFIKVGADLANFTSPLPILVLHNFGAGAVPGVNGYGPFNDGSYVAQVARQPAALAILAPGTNGLTAFTNSVAVASRAGLRLRGTSSFNFVRKSYSLETWTETDEEGRDLPLLGMPADNDWVLYGPSPSNYDDVLIHNSFIFELARQSGYPAPRWRFVEVFLNTNGTDLAAANNLGLYLLMERIKRGRDRVDFPPLSADGAQGGWMLSIDRMDSLPVGFSTNSGLAPRHFHTAGPDRILQTEDDNQRGYQNLTGPSGLPPRRDDFPDNYNSFFNFDSPGGWEILSAQRAAIQNYLRAFDLALSGPDFADPALGYAPYVDVDNFVHHYICQNFPKNTDCIFLSTYLLRESPQAKLKFGPLWDFDRAFNKNSGGSTAPSNDLYYASRVFYPRLFQDSDFKQAYIDKWQTLRRGAFATSNLLAIADAQTAEITAAVAARSGLTAAAWSNNLVTFKTWLQQRAMALDGQFLMMPAFNQEGGAIANGFLVILTNLSPGSTVFFTLDGTDPRARGGGIAATAQAWPQTITLNATTVVRARSLQGTNWSGLAEAVFYPPQDLSRLTLTEIMYNPPSLGATNGDGFEFLEIQNRGTNTLNLSGLHFSAGLSFTFTNGTLLEPGQFFLLGRDAAALAALHPGVVVNGLYTGRLDNAGETLTLSTALGTPVFSVAYNDRAPWPVAADGFGFSLVPKDPDAAQAPDHGAHWRASSLPGGSPGAPDPEPAIPPIVINEVLSASVPPLSDAIELFNPSGATAEMGGWFLTDDPGYPWKYRIPDGTVLSHGGFLVFTEADFNPTPGTNVSFALNALGDDAYLFSADTNGTLTGYSHGFSFGAVEPGATFGRHVTSDGKEHFPPPIIATLAATNSGPRVGPLVISEIMYNPPPGGVEYLELANLSAAPLPLFDPNYPSNTWRLNGAGFSFPAGAVVPPGESVLVVATNPESFRLANGLAADALIYGPLTGALQDSGERLTVERPGAPATNGVIPFYPVDEVRYNDRAPWPAAADGSGLSLQRVDLSAFGSEPTNWTAQAPSPGVPADTDGDGLPDAWELAHGLSPMEADAAVDSDGDGHSNLSEYLAGTHPREAASALKITGVLALTNRTAFSFAAMARRSYTVQFSDTVTGTLFRLADFPARPTNRVETVTDTNNGGSRFYRVLTPQMP